MTATSTHLLIADERAADKRKTYRQKKVSGWPYIHWVYSMLKDQPVDDALLQEETITWFPQYEKAGEVKQEIARRNLKLVVWRARESPYTYMPLLDRIQEGNIGLLRAIDTYECKRKWRFSTYAQWWINQAIRRPLHNVRIVYIPEQTHPEIAALEAVVREFENSGRGSPSDEEFAEHLHWDLDKIQRVQQARRLRYVSSLDNSVISDDDTKGSFLTITDDEKALSPEAILIQKEDDFSRKVQRLLAILTPREADIMSLRLGIAGHPHTLDEIGKIFDLSRERIRQIEAGAKAKLRSEFGAEYGLLP